MRVSVSAIAAAIKNVFKFYSAKSDSWEGPHKILDFANSIIFIFFVLPFFLVGPTGEEI